MNPVSGLVWLMVCQKCRLKCNTKQSDGNVFTILSINRPLEARRTRATTGLMATQNNDPRRKRPGNSTDRTLEQIRSEEHTSELQSLMRISYAVFRLKKKNITNDIRCTHQNKSTNT